MEDMERYEELQREYSQAVENEHGMANVLRAAIERYEDAKSMYGEACRERDKAAHALLDAIREMQADN